MRGGRRLPCAPRAALALSLLAALSAVASWSNPAFAFCRTRTCEFRNDVACPEDPVTGCKQAGEFIYWQTGCVPFAVQRDGSEDENISGQQVAQLLEQGFRAWSSVSCAGGGSPAISTASQGLIACDAVEFDCEAGEQNSNLVMFRDNFATVDSGLRFSVIALTTVTANLVSGQIFDADIELNSRDENFSLTATSGSRRDLRGVINHELGHLLGLSHSNVAGSLMRASYEGTVEPADDDAEAMCLSFDTSGSDPACQVEQLPASAECLGSNTSCRTVSRSSAEPDSSGCACRQARASDGGPGGWWWVAGLGLWLSRRKLRRAETML
ncbi:MAG: hypothetical protein RL033_1828 [Pseudomonadota bacterium]